MSCHQSILEALQCRMAVSRVSRNGSGWAVEIIHRRRLKSARNPEQERVRLTEDFNEKFANPYKAAALGYIDDVIEPSETRTKLARALEMLIDKEELRPARKHGNIPL